MYNRYIPEDTSYTWVGEEHKPQPSSAERSSGKNTPASGMRNSGISWGKESLSGLLNGAGSLFGGRGGSNSGLLKALRLEELDTGDVLLLLIVLFLLVEGDDLELVIALGLVLILGLGDEREKTDCDTETDRGRP